MGKNPPVSTGDTGDEGRCLFWEDPLERKRQPTPVLLSGESHGRRSLAGFSPQDCKESDTTEHIELTFKMNVYNITAVTTVIALCGKIQEKKDFFNNPSTLTS